MKVMSRVAIGLGVVAIIGASITAYQLIAPGSASEIEIVLVADRFQGPESWELESEKITAPNLLCLDGTCPEVHRSWSTPSLLTYDELEELLSASGLNIPIDGDCVPSTLTVGAQVVCSATGPVDGFIMTVNVVTPRTSDRPNLVTLNIRPPVA